ncbi:ATP-dependent Clp protease adaptor ClpS [Candidatus Riflebacteria bacterium]
MPLLFFISTYCISKPEIGERLYEITIFDNDINSYAEVIETCMLVLNINMEEAFNIAYTIDTQGKYAMQVGGKNKANDIAKRIGKIGIKIKVERI